MLTGEPQESFPRRAVNRYNRSRSQALAQPGQRALWEQFDALCRELQQQLAHYRAEPGSSTEVISFSREKLFLDRLLQEPQWGSFQQIVAP
jgi:hypothetical protein